MLLDQLLWQSPGALCSGTLPVRAGGFSFDNEADALAAAGTAEHGAYCVSLNGCWKFRYLEDPARLTDADLDADCTRWNDITVPGAWTVQGYDRPHYTNVQMPYAEKAPQVPEKNPTGIYRCKFICPEAWQGRRIILHFDGVESCFSVRVNGRDAGFAKNSRGAHEFDITGYCRAGENELAVLVVKWSVLVGNRFQGRQICRAQRFKKVKCNAFAGFAPHCLKRKFIGCNDFLSHFLLRSGHKKTICVPGLSNVQLFFQQIYTL